MRAVQYVRMSTEQQRYSIEYQTATNAAYAAARGYEIVGSYVDAGVSGLSLHARDGLKRLLGDVLGGAADFQAILVYDVSRWGRFQDPDEGAHYEYVCRAAGVAVEYTAEPFANDGALVSTLVKHMKRAMAAEFSRELSAKIARAKRGLAARGYWQGGPSAYGFRRRILRAAGSLGPILQSGEHKELHGQRTILVCGPDDEVAVVRRVFRAFLAGEGTRDIARALNAERISAGAGSVWTRSRVRRMLTDEKYAGVLVAGRRAFELRRGRAQPRAAWTRVPKACPALVPRAWFDRVQARLRGSKPPATDEAMLAALRAVLAERGRLSYEIVRKDSRTHHPSVYARRFGTLLAAFERAGYDPPARQREAAWRARRDQPHLRRRYLKRRSEAEMLQTLQEILAAHGRLTLELIDAWPGAPSLATYRNRFGSLQGAYAAVGYEPSPRQCNSGLGRPKPVGRPGDGQPFVA